MTQNLVWLSAAGTVVAGLGFGASALATFGTFARVAGLPGCRVAGPHERSAVFTLANVIAYLETACPPYSVASPSPRAEARPEIYALAIVLITAAALVLRLNRIRAERRVVLAPCE